MSNRNLKYKIVIFDVGKTLFDKKISNKVSDLLVKDILKLKNQGVKVGLCTMRTITHCKDIIPITFDFYICLNGSLIVCDGNIVYDAPVKLDFKCKDYLTYDQDIAFCSTEIAWQNAIKNGFLANKIGESNCIYNAVFFNINKNSLEEYSNYHYEYWADTKTLVLQDLHSSRKNAVDIVMNYYGVTLPILYFGDGPNDLEIFQNYHDCICMGDCYPLLKKYALFQTDTCKNEGISKALYRLKLI